MSRLYTCEAQRVAWAVDTTTIAIAKAQQQRVEWLVDDLETTRALLVELWNAMQHGRTGCPMCGAQTAQHCADCRLQAAIADYKDPEDE